MGRFWYLATPYSKYPGGMEAAYKEATHIAGSFILDGLSIYCPIAHSHLIAQYSGLDPQDHSIWLYADKPFMISAVGLIVVQMPSWARSYGIQQEIKAFRGMKKPIMYLEVDERNEDV